MEPRPYIKFRVSVYKYAYWTGDF